MQIAPRIPNALRTGALALAIGAFAGLPAHAAVPAACNPVVDAMIKQVATPSHAYVTRTAASLPGKIDTTESIYAGGAIYVKVKGAWHRSGMSAADMQKQQEENRRDTTGMSCRYLRDEVVNGEAAAVYGSDIKDEGDSSSAMIWISKSKGVPLRIERDANAGGKAGKSHMAIRYEYGAIQPPAGVK